MSWPTGTVAGHLTQLRTQLAACASFTAAGGSSSTIHYAFCNISGVRGTADALPAILITSATVKRIPFAEGAAPVKGGAFKMVLYASLTACPYAANIEALADSILQDLTAQETGHIWGEPEIGDSSDPSGAADVADTGSTVTNYRSIEITISWGIQP